MQTANALPFESEQSFGNDSITIDDPLPQLIADLKDASKRQAAIHELGRLGPLACDALPHLRELFHSSETETLAPAARAVGQMGLEALSLLTELLKHPRRSVRREAVWALARLGPQAKSAIPALCETLRDPDPRTAAGAAQALANMGPLAESAIPDLLEALNSVNLIHSRLVAKALSNVGPRALPALLTRLGDPRPFVRREVIVAIGFMGMRAAPAVPALTQRLQELRHQEGIAPAPKEIDEFEKTIPTSVLVVDFDPRDEAVTILETLARIGPAALAAKATLQEMLRDADPRLSHTAAQTLLQITGWQ